MIPGFLLLSSHLGDPERQTLSQPQLGQLTRAIRSRQLMQEGEELEARHLQALGYGRDMTEKILALLEQKDLLERYLDRARSSGCFPLTRGEEDYPALTRSRLGGRCPGCFFGKGNRSLLNTPAIALVGSRELHEPNREFAREAGRQAAAHGLTLISGNARGADREAQESCRMAGGSVISVVADSLTDKQADDRILYLSQEDFDAPFSPMRALSRNQVIHTMGYMTLVAQCRLGQGGTWSGTTRNLQHGWSLVVCFRDGSSAAAELRDRGAYLLGTEELAGLSELGPEQMRLF